MTSIARGAALSRDQTARFFAKPLAVLRSATVLLVPICGKLTSKRSRRQQCQPHVGLLMLFD